MIPGTEEPPNDLGVYAAKVGIDGKANNGRGKYSTFFPKDMTQQEVVDAINEVYEKIKKQGIIGEDTYSDITSKGMIIEMYINSNGKIATAYPRLE